MRKRRKLRRLTIDVTKFLADYNDAIASNMPVAEFCEVTGLHISTLHGRLRTLASRGVVLPLLNGMRKRTKMGRLLGACPSITPDSAPAPKGDGIDYDRLANAVLRRLTTLSQTP